MKEYVAGAIIDIVDYCKKDNQDDPLHKRAHYDAMKEEIEDIRNAYFTYKKTMRDDVMDNLNLTVSYLRHDKEPDLKRIKELWQ
ncbi:hypothetical protein AXA88_27220 [Salmonella enterica]|nr:hypothetical protein [Salmonella enterica]EAX3609504.1 hypothetical protein [Salmonella enterica]EGW6283054.1 hypothetical protein [Salmonella enterica]EGX3935484.1 hypothetical protein [Salmonella enterica]